MLWCARVIGLVWLAAALTGCDGSEGTPTSPTRPVVPGSPFVGTWTGSIADSAAGGGSLRVNVSEHVAISLLGSWAVTFADQAFNDSGRLTGGVDGSAVRLFLTGQPCASSGMGSRTITATLGADGGRLTGSYVSLGCGAPRGGEIELRKE